MRSLGYLNKYFIKYKWRFLLGILFTVVSNYFGARMPVIVMDAVNGMKNELYASTVESSLMLALKIGGIYMLFSFIKGFFLFLMRQTIIIMSRLIEYDLKNEVFAQYQRMGFAFYQRNRIGDLMNRISEDVSQVRSYLGPGIMYSINLVVMFALCIYQMVKISPMLTVYVLIPLPLMSFMIYKVSSKMNALSKEVQGEQSMMSTIVQESFSGIRLIKAYNRAEEMNDKFTQSAEGYHKKTMRLVVVNALFMPTIIFLIGLSTILAIYIGGKMTYTGELSIGGIVAFIFFVNNLTWPFASIGWVTSIIQRASASQERINEFLKQPAEIVNPSLESFEFEGKIEFKNVSYTYSDSNITAIKDLSFTIHKGETLAFVGKTGSGKSTILRLILRQVDPEHGEIDIDGVALNRINIAAFRDQSGIVPQEITLFSDNIANNISFGSHSENITQERIVEMAKLAHVDHNIQEFPERYETLLGERGVNLSGGQKQRLSIARALVREPKLLLLDDCFSALDSETEEIILSNLKKVQKNRTTIIVSHRISSLRNADRIIVLDHGQLAEEGSHDELLGLNGIYAEMYTAQLAESKEI
jgi:ATP-binding cassette subfamily B multidrug efflux pump